MSKHYYIYSNNERHGAVFTKGLIVVKPKNLHPRYYLEFHYKDGKEYDWYFESSSELLEAYNKVKKCLPNGKNIDEILKL